jgi:hypothetical protein
MTTTGFTFETPTILPEGKSNLRLYSVGSFMDDSDENGWPIEKDFDEEENDDELCSISEEEEDWDLDEQQINSNNQQHLNATANNKYCRVFLNLKMCHFQNIKIWQKIF